MSFYATTRVVQTKSLGTPCNDISVFEGSDKNNAVARMLIGPGRLLAVVHIPNAYEIHLLPPDSEEGKIKEIFAKILQSTNVEVKPNAQEYAGKLHFTAVVSKDDAEKFLDAIANLSDGVFGKTQEFWLKDAKEFINQDHSIRPENEPCTIS